MAYKIRAPTNRHQDQGDNAMTNTTADKKTAWIRDHVQYLKGLKKRKDYQDELIMLFDKPDRTKQEDKKLDGLVTAERLAKRAAEALLHATMPEIKKSERKAVNNKKYELAGLLGVAGLMDKKTGLPAIDRGELLGGFLAMAKVPADDQRRREWKRAGDEALARIEKEKSEKKKQTSAQEGA